NVLNNQFQQIQGSMKTIASTRSGHTFFDELKKVAGELNPVVDDLTRRADKLRQKGFTEPKDVKEFKEIQAQLEAISNIFTAIDNKRRKLSAGRDSPFLKKENKEEFQEFFSTFSGGIDNLTRRTQALGQELKRTVRGGFSDVDPQQAVGDINRILAARQLLLDKLRDTA